MAAGDTLRTFNAEPPDLPRFLPPNCRKVLGNLDGQISYKNDESNKQMKTQLSGEAAAEKADYAPPPEEAPQEAQHGPSTVVNKALTGRIRPQWNTIRPSSGMN
jgi:hypothetical protein